ncbi:hypothetical protein CR205_13085 [Alteribacter lacisalsi]|uniref:Uncharacterized protein n=1 Tax=Alteribacter lacisalsi TaxID=2045244 RepID=A0A2W0HI35_9BACI|nr:hypothetical protein [Alteribacter lacisalsi]PYZ96632.1 hypothetical protein CR205_13085 [Alteribacter lacisalsi]
MSEITYIIEEQDNLLSALPKYQQDTINTLLEQGKTPEEVSQIWLEANGPSNTFPFGADNKKNPFLENLNNEINDFICSEDKYKNEKKQLIERWKSGEVVVVSFIAVSIATVLGTAPALILPIIVLSLRTAGKIGVNAWCESRK